MTRTPADLSALVTHRDVSMFAHDWDAAHGRLTEMLDGARVLVVGGAGSIGASAVALLAEFETTALHVIDQNENGLAEVVRDLRGRPTPPRCRELRLLPLEFGSAVMQAFVEDQAPYDAVLNFAAVKHVRSEKDVYSTLQMLSTNVLKQVDLLQWLGRKPSKLRYFSVSTDKAANPVNLMGASKRLMEHVMFGRAHASSFRTTTSARFANVAFSDGSLLQGWQQRLVKRQPIAVPRDVRRYFVSLQESGHICVLSSLVLDDAHIAIPRLDPSSDLRLLEAIAVEFIEHHGYEPSLFTDQQEAVRAVDSELKRGRYPLLLTPLDTIGEKAFEEFVGANENARDVGLSGLLAIPYAASVGADAIDAFVQMLRDAVQKRTRVDKDDLLRAIAGLIPELEHAASPNKLDERL